MEVADKKKLKVPKLRFRGFDDGWHVQTLGDLLTFKNGVNAEKGQYGSGYKFINVLDIIQNDFITHDVILGEVELSEKEVEKNEVKYGDILFQRSSETREEVGQANVYLDKEKTAVFGGFVIRGSAKGEYNPSFMNGMLKTAQARKEITTRSGGSTRYNIGQESLEAVTVFIPTLPEQKKIADFLSAVNARIQQLNRKKELLEKYKKGVMQKLFAQELRFKQADGTSYADWEEKRLGEVCKTYSGGTPLTSKRFYYIGNIPFIRSAEINSDHAELNISDEGLKSSSAKMVSKGSLLYAMYGATAGEVGISKIDGAINQAVLCIVTKQNVAYIHQYLKLMKGRILSTFLQGGQGNLSADIVKSVKIPLCAKEEQQKIADFLSSLDKKIGGVSAQIEKTQQFKKGLLQEMFV